MKTTTNWTILGQNTHGSFAWDSGEEKWLSDVETNSGGCAEVGGAIDMARAIDKMHFKEDYEGLDRIIVCVEETDEDGERVRFEEFEVWRA